MLNGFEGLALALCVSFLAVIIHYESLRLISMTSIEKRGYHRTRILMVILGVIAAHLVEAGVYAVGFWLGVEFLGLGRFAGSPPENAFQYYYFALETYTTQSVGDLYPVGGLRILAAIEPLVGLILISWSASLTFVAMRRYWRRGSD